MPQLVTSAVTNWRTSTAGLVLGAAVLVGVAAFKPGMTVTQWLTAAGFAILAALPGILAKDGVHP